MVDQSREVDRAAQGATKWAVRSLIADWRRRGVKNVSRVARQMTPEELCAKLFDFESEEEAEVARTVATDIHRRLASGEFDRVLSSGRAPVVRQRRTAPRRRGSGRPAGRRASHRSSARSGDSGDSSDGESEPPQHGRQYLGAFA